MKAAITGRVDEGMRIMSARATERIAKRWGTSLPMWIGSGYPKSGTVWLCKLMSAYLGVPYPQNYRLPVAMSSVIHAHWEYDERLPRTAYISRDGRDVMVSLYFHHMRNLAERRNPHSAGRLRQRLERRLGVGFDPQDVRTNLPGFIESEFTEPAYSFGTWHEHVRSWCMPRHDNVAYVSYEELIDDTVPTFARLMTDLTGAPADNHKVELACARQSFRVLSGREPGAEDRTSFLRSGTAGSWREYFTPEAARIFDQHAGPALVALGYADPDWARTLDG